MNILEQLKIIENGGVQAFIFGTVKNIHNKHLNISFYSDVRSVSSHYDSLIRNSDREFFYPPVDFTCEKKRIKRIWGKRREFYKFLKSHKFDIVHIHANRTHDVSYALMAKLSGCPTVILHIHNAVREYKISEKILTFFCRIFMLFSADIFIACSESAAEHMFPSKILKEKKYILLKNGIDPAKFKFCNKKRLDFRNTFGLENKFVIANVSRLSKLKNHKFLIKIFEEVCKKNPNSMLILSGKGEMESDIKQLAFDSVFSDRIIFTGELADPSECLCAADVFVMPSLSEGLGIAAIEAQASGLHTICSDTVPPEAAVTDLCEFLSLSAPPEVWAKKILSYDNGYERKDMSEQIRAAGYDINDTAQKLEEIYIKCKDNMK